MKNGKNFFEIWWDITKFLDLYLILEITWNWIEINLQTEWRFNFNLKLICFK